jgi:preprotein translocase subunit SecE
VGKVFDYFREVRIELSKVVWPKRSEVIKLTSIVFIISAMVGLYAGVLDLALTKLLEFLVAS